MSFNPDPTKPAEEILFSQKRLPQEHLPLYFNGIEVKRVSEHKHLGFIFDPKLNCAAHFKEKSAKARKGIGIIKQLRKYLPTSVLDQIYKMHARSHLDYCDFIYHIPELREKNKNSDDSIENENSDCNLENDIDTNYPSSIKLNYQMRALESILYQAGLAVTGAWKGSSTLKIYDELGWESLHHRRYFRRITQFFKIMNGLTPQYLVDPVPMPRRHLFGRHPTNDLYEFSYRNQRFLNSFYPDSVVCWNKLSPETRKIDTLKKFKENILKDIKPEPKSIFNLHDPDGIKFIYQLRVGLSPLREHKNRHNFLDTPCVLCSCGTGAESTEHFLLKCPSYTEPRKELLTTINSVIELKIQSVHAFDNISLIEILLYGHENLNPSQNKGILSATIDYIQKTERFN